MKIHDALIYELIEPSKSGRPTGGILKIVESTRWKIKYNVEWSNNHPNPSVGMIAPDVIVEILEPRPRGIDDRRVALEIETDWDLDFGKSLRQVKDYRSSRFFRKVVVIVPEYYEQFGILYKNEGLDVWLWKAIREWQCLRCGTITEKEGTFQPICRKCESKNRSEFRLFTSCSLKIRSGT